LREARLDRSSHDNCEGGQVGLRNDKKSASHDFVVMKGAGIALIIDSTTAVLANGGGGGGDVGGNIATTRATPP
jgi:hypothetical protein